MDGQPHVTPIGDLRRHAADGIFCPCMPLERYGVVVHNSYDGREVGEVCRHAIDVLGLALANHGHQWTVEECNAFESAMHVLEMHWPERKAEHAA